MIISLDYDDTYTKDTEFWDKVVKLGKKHGHTFYCVTARAMEPDNYEPKPNMKIYCTSHEYKKKFMQNLGIDIDVWIDDTPEALIEGKEWN